MFEILKIKSSSRKLFGQNILFKNILILKHKFLLKPSLEQL